MTPTPHPGRAVCACACPGNKRLVKAGQPGFTLVEMAVVLGIVSLLAFLLLPALGRTTAKARRIQCLSNLRQTGIAFHSFMHDHGDSFPMDLSTNAGGTWESLETSYLTKGDFYLSYVHFQALSNELANPRVLACPADVMRSAAGDFSDLENKHVSYFVGANADYSLANSILAGDRNLNPVSGARQSLLRLNDDNPAVWTRDLHGFKGNELCADGHVERVNTMLLRLHRRNSPTVMDLMLPSLKSSQAPPAALAQATPGATAPTDPAVGIQ